MKSDQQFEHWFAVHYGTDPRSFPAFMEANLYDEWIQGIYAKRELKNQQLELSQRLEMESRVDRGERARTALDAADRWKMLHEAASAAWSQALLLNPRKPR